MDTEIIVAMITAGFAFAGALLASLMGNSKTLYRIEQLEKKVDKHNQVIERTFKLEQKIEDLEGWVESIDE